MSTAPQQAKRRANPLVILLRIVIVTLAFGILGLGLGGLFGIISIAIINLAGQTTDMSMALFAGGAPGAVIGLLTGLVLMVRSERHAIQARKHAA